MFTTILGPLNFVVCFMAGLLGMTPQPVYAVNRRNIGIARVGRDRNGQLHYEYHNGATRDLLTLMWPIAIGLMLAYLQYAYPDLVGDAATGIAATGIAKIKKQDPPEIAYDGNRITLPNVPDKMKLQTAIDWLTKLKNDEESIVAVHEHIEGYDPNDAAHAFMLAMRRVYGWTSHVPTPGFFGSTPPQFLNVATDVDVTTPVAVGRFQLPNVQGWININPANGDEEQHHLCVYGEVLKRDRHHVLHLLNVTREILKTDSIYRGKAIRFEWDRDNERPKTPVFVNVASARPDHLVFSRDIAEQVDTTIFTPLRKRAMCAELNVPFKRGVCLMGPYGTGKTLAIYVASKYAVENNVTAIIVEDAETLPQAMKFARQYAPALVVCEDIDRVTKERNNVCNEIMDALDGAEAKDRDVMVLFTSNDADSIHPAMRRPGRIDTFIKVDPPDAEAVEKLLRLYGQDRISLGEDLTEVSNMLRGQIPAVIREVVERAKLAAVRRAITVEDAQELWADDLEISARRMLMQLELFEGKQDQSIGAALAVASGVLSAQAKTLGEVAIHEMRHPAIRGVATAMTPSRN